ncbi:MAG: Uncharacterised protein [Flavobacteriia bacterium]|nr:MAG: Uncharacterised protein [Flavobacteriia bacterium]
MAAHSGFSFFSQGADRLDQPGVDRRQAVQFLSGQKIKGFPFHWTPGLSIAQEKPQDPRGHEQIRAGISRNRIQLAGLPSFYGRICCSKSVPGCLFLRKQDAICGLIVQCAQPQTVGLSPNRSEYFKKKNGASENDPAEFRSHRRSQLLQPLVGQGTTWRKWQWRRIFLPIESPSPGEEAVHPIR